MNNTPEDPDVPQRPIRLPLWKSCLDEMRKLGIDYNVEFTTPWLEDQLKSPRDSHDFGMAICNINDVIMGEGHYLSARDQNGEAYKIVGVRESEGVADARVRKSFREMRRANVLYAGIAANPKAELTLEDKRRLESKAAKAAMRLSLMARAAAFENKPEQALTSPPP